MACGAPVVAARTGALEEVAGGAAVLVDPLDPECDHRPFHRGDRPAPGAAVTRLRACACLRLARGGAPRDGRRVPRSRGMSARSSRSTPTCSDGSEQATRPTCAPCSANSPRPRRATCGWRRSPAAPTSSPAGIEPVELPARSQVMRMAVSVPRLLRRLRPALAHFVHALPLWCPCPAVVTIQDLSFERDPCGVMGTRDRLIFRVAVPRAARRATRVLAISELTKRDLVELYEIPPSRRSPSRRSPPTRPSGPKALRPTASRTRSSSARSSRARRRRPRSRRWR